MGIRLITFEEFFMKAGICEYSETDIAKVQAFIDARELDEYIFNIIPEQVICAYAEHLMNDEPLSYEEILETEISKENYEVEKSRQICIAVRRDTNLMSLVVDRTLGKVYFNRRGFIIDDISRAEKSIKLTDELWNRCLDILREMDLEHAEDKYDGDTQYRSYTVVAIKYLDKGVKRTESVGGGVPASIPKGAMDLMRLFA